MLVSLTRHGASAKRFFEDCLAMVEGSTLVIIENRITKETPHPTREAAVTALEKLVLRREKAGWKVTLRSESSWVAWRGELARMTARVIDEAKGYGIDTGGRYGSGIQRLGPRDHDEIGARIPDEYAELVHVGAAWVHFLLGGPALRFDIRFEIGQFFPVSGRRSEESWLWRRIDAGKTTDYGEAKDGRLVSYVGGELGFDADPICHVSAEAFQMWFLRYVRDDTMSAVLGELRR